MRKVKNVDSGYRLFGGGGCNGVTQMVVITRYIGVVHTRKRSVSLIRRTFVSHTLSDNTVPYRLCLEDIYRNRVFMEAT